MLFANPAALELTIKVFKSAGNQRVGVFAGQPFSPGSAFGSTKSSAYYKGGTPLVRTGDNLLGFCCLLMLS
jgi:hypothetical protein